MRSANLRFIVVPSAIAVLLCGGLLWAVKMQPRVRSTVTAILPKSALMNLGFATPTRISHIIVYGGSTPNPHLNVDTDFPPGIPTPHWLFSEDQAVQHVKLITRTDLWKYSVVRRTTIDQWNYLESARNRAWSSQTSTMRGPWLLKFLQRVRYSPPSSPPPITWDNSEAVWVIAFETEEMLTTGQITYVNDWMSDSDAGDDEERGKKAVIVIDEGGNPQSGHFLEEIHPGGRVSQGGPTFAQIAALPAIPGTIPSPTP